MRRAAVKKYDHPSHRHFPVEIIVCILSRLPVKSLIRFRCVSKSWYSLIAQPYFINIHLLHNMMNQNRDIYVLWNDYGHRSVTLDRHFVEHTQIVSPIDRKSNIVSGCINGIVCICDRKLASLKETFYLWNPAARILKTIVSPKYEEDYHHIVGFGFHPQANDYRIVKIQQHTRHWERVFLEVYSLATNSWTLIDTNATINYFMYSKFPPFIHGSLHFFGSKSDIPEVVITFDIVDATIREMMIPHDDEAYYSNMILLSFKGSLAIFVYGGFSERAPSLAIAKRSDLWVMKEYGVSKSWTKLYSLNTELGVARFLGFSEELGVIFFHRLPLANSIEVEAWDAESGKIGKIIKGVRFGHVSSHSFVSFTESLILLNGGMDVSPFVDQFRGMKL